MSDLDKLEDEIAALYEMLSRETDRADRAEREADDERQLAGRMGVQLNEALRELSDRRGSGPKTQAANSAANREQLFDAIDQRRVEVAEDRKADRWTPAWPKDEEQSVNAEAVRRALGQGPVAGFQDIDHVKKLYRKELVRRKAEALAQAERERTQGLHDSRRKRFEENKARSQALREPSGEDVK